MASIRNIKDKDGNVFYPLTHERAVRDSNGVNLETKLGELNSRPYNSQDPNGMGYIVLEKGKTFASQVTATNTIYEIRYDFDLNSSAITLPENSILYFNGGQLSNGYPLNGNNSQVFTNSNNAIFRNVTLGGTWCNRISYSSWFYESRQIELNSCCLLSDIVYIDKDITFDGDFNLPKSNISIIGIGNVSVDNGDFSFNINNRENVIIKDFKSIGPSTNRAAEASKYPNRIFVSNSNNVKIQNVVFDKWAFHLLPIHYCNDIIVENCQFLETGAVVSNTLLWALKCNNILVRNNKFENLGLVYNIRLDFCVHGKVIENYMVNIGNNPIIINTGCENCIVSKNYLNTSHDSGILCANDEVEVNGTWSCEPPKDIVITDNIIINQQDTGIGVYQAKTQAHCSTTKECSNIIISNNYLKDNGLTSSAKNYSSQMYLAGNNHIVSGNTFIKEGVPTSPYDIVGIRLGTIFPNARVDYEDNYFFAKITGNTFKGLTPISSMHLDASSADYGTYTDQGKTFVIDIHNVTKDENTNLPKNSELVTWYKDPNAYDTVFSINADENTMSLTSYSGGALSQIDCTINSEIFGKKLAIIKVSGLYKMSSTQGIDPTFMSINTNGNARILKDLVLTDEYIPFTLNAIVETESPKIIFGSVYYGAQIVYKDVIVEVQILNI